jgi:hypothetical protein
MSIISKELKATTRNGRLAWLLLMSFLIPFAVFFMLFRFSGQLIQQQIEENSKKKYKVAWVSKGTEASEIRKKLERNQQIQLIDSLDEDEVQEFIELDSLAVGIVISENFDSAVSKREKAVINLYFKGDNRGTAIVQKIIGNYRREISKRNVNDLKLPEGISNPIEINENDLSNIQEIIDNVSEMLNSSVAILLSLILFIFGIIGARYSLNELFWKERESGVNIYYLQSVIKPSKIFFIKMLLASGISFLMMFLSLLGFALAISFDQDGIIQGIILQIKSSLTWTSIGLIMFLALPMSVIFTGFWGLLKFLFRNKIAGFLSNFGFMLLLILVLIVGTSTTLLNDGNAFLPFMNFVIFIKTLISAEMGMMPILLSFLGAAIWGILFQLFNLFKFRSFSDK